MNKALLLKRWKPRIEAWSSKIWLNLKLVLLIIKETFAGWTRSGATAHAAALAFFTLLSLAPLVVVTVAVASQFFSQPSVEARILAEAEQAIGEDGANYIQGVIRSNQDKSSSNLATILSLLFLLYGASTMFHQLQMSLNMIWGVPQTGQSFKEGVLAFLKTRSLAALLAIFVGGLMMASLLVQAVWEFIPKQFLFENLPALDQYRPYLALLLPPILLMLVFMLLYKTLLGKRARWKHVWVGAMVTTVLYWVGQSLFDLYFSGGAIKHMYGTAGSVIVLMLWAYYAATILLFGAKFTWVYIAKTTPRA
jgi:membrane protein